MRVKLVLIKAMCKYKVMDLWFTKIIPCPWAQEPTFVHRTPNQVIFVNLLRQ